MVKSELVQLYDYIKYCLYAHQAQYLKKLGTLIDMQHDIFLYLVEKKGIVNFNSGSKRFAYILAQYHPTYLRRYKYSRRIEDVLVDEDGETIDYGISNEMSGDVLHDLNLIGNIEVKKGRPGKKIVVEYEYGENEYYDSIQGFATKIGCAEQTVHKWIKNGFSWSKDWSKSNGKFKGLHIKSIKYMAIYSNPFNGSKTVVKKKLSEVAWEKRDDKEEFELEDENEMVKLFVHKESGEGWMVKTKDPKGSEFYIKRFEDGNKKD